MMISECVSKDRHYYNSKKEQVPGCMICRFNRKCNLAVYRLKDKGPKGGLIQRDEDDIQPDDQNGIEDEDFEERLMVAI
jgi:hypothetical protein